MGKEVGVEGREDGEGATMGGKDVGLDTVRGVGESVRVEWEKI